MDIVGYDILEDGGLRYAWKDARFKKCIESAAFINRSKGKLEDICGYTTSVSSGCILRTQGNQCAFCRTGNVLPFGGLLTYKEIAKQNIFMVLSDIYCEDHPELHNKKREFAYMGQGEPGYSYSQVRMAIELTNTVMRELNQQVYRHIFATCGIPEAVDNYMSDVQHYFTERVTLHLSLHVAGDRDLIMPINKLYPIEETVKKVNQVAEVSGEKPCVGIMLFNNFRPKGKTFSYTNSVEMVMEILKKLNPGKCRLSFCEYNSSDEIGEADEYPQELVGKLLETVREYGFEAKHFSPYGRKKMTACGMLGSKEPEKLASKKWLELNALADELIAKNV